MEIKHEKLELSFVLPEFRQRDVEAYFKALRDIQGGEVNLSAPEFVGCVVRAAAKCGWLEGATEESVGDMKPAAVMWLSDSIQMAIREATAVPGE